MSAITRHVFDRYGWNERPALGFRQVGDSQFPLVIGVIGGSPQIYALALSTTVERNSDDLGARAAPSDRADLGVERTCARKSSSRGAEVDIGILPQVVWTPSQDPGPYITAPLVVTKDPETGRRNVGTYRLQMKGPQRLGLYVGGAQHAARHIRQYDARKEDMPVAIAIGVDPTIVLASITKFTYGTDEFAVAGGLRGEAVPLVRCETVDLEVPANAEIVLEGIIRAGYREPEGPFGEFSGYMSPGGETPVIELTCMTRRREPVYHSFLSQMPPSESSCIRSLSRSAGLFHHLKQVFGMPVRDVHFTESGGASSMLVISMKKEYPEQVKEIAWGAWSLMNKEVQVYHRRRRRHRRAQSVSGRMGDELSRPTGAGHFHGERRRALRRRSVDGAVGHSAARPAAPHRQQDADRCDPQASLPAGGSGAAGIHSSGTEEMAGVRFY